MVGCPSSCRLGEEVPLSIEKRAKCRVDLHRFLLMEKVAGDGEALDAQVAHEAIEAAEEAEAEVGIELAPQHERGRGDDAHGTKPGEGTRKLAIVCEGCSQSPRNSNCLHVALDVVV